MSFVCDACKGTGKVKEIKRTGSQNNALHVFCTQLAEVLNDMGLEPRKLLKPTYNLRWTKHSIKDDLWRPIQEAMTGKKSTTDLKKTEEIDLIHSTLMRELGEKHHVEYIKWPAKCEKHHNVLCPDCHLSTQ